MKKFPKLVQCDKRGQIVIPKEVRQDLGIEEGTGFYMYIVTDEGILLKKLEDPNLEKDPTIAKLIEKADKLNMNPANLGKMVDDYKKTTQGGFDLI